MVAEDSVVGGGDTTAATRGGEAGAILDVEDTMLVVDVGIGDDEVGAVAAPRAYGDGGGEQPRGTSKAECIVNASFIARLLEASIAEPSGGIGDYCEHLLLFDAAAMHVDCTAGSSGDGAKQPRRLGDGCIASASCTGSNQASGS